MRSSEFIVEGFVNYEGLRPPKNVPGVNLFPGKDIVGQRVYHCTNQLEAIKKSGGLKPRRDATGEREYGRLSTNEHPFTPVIGIWFSVGKPDWVGKHCVSFVIEPTDQVYVAYASTEGLKPNVVLNPIPLNRLTVEDQQETDVAKDSLNELGNTSLKVKEPQGMYNVNDRKQHTYKLFKFKAGKDKFLIAFTVKGAPAFGKKQNWNAVNVAFGVKEKDNFGYDDDMDTELTGKNKNQFLIYSTVINTIHRFITEYNTEIDEIIMQGAGERQEAMYQRFFQSASKYFPGWHYSGKQSLVRDVPRQTGKKFSV